MRYIKKLQCVYVMESASGLIKIGITQNIAERKTCIECNSGFRILQVYNTDFLVNADEIEKEAHKYFESYRTVGEWFQNISFVDAVTIVDKISKLKGAAEPDYQKAVELLSENLIRLVKKANKDYEEILSLCNIKNDFAIVVPRIVIKDNNSLTKEISDELTKKLKKSKFIVS